MLFSRNPNNNTDETIRVFKRDDHGSFNESPTIPGTPFAEDFFGSEISISGDFALIGSPGDGGRAVLYKQTDAGLDAQLGYSGNSWYDYMGIASDLQDKALIVGAPGMSNFNFNYGSSNGQGAAFVATRETDWSGNVQSERLAPSGPKFHNFGASVAIHGNTAVVGAPGDGYAPPATWVFERNEMGKWRQAAVLHGDSSIGRFGAAVDVRDDVIVIGDPKESSNFYATGATYIFRHNEEYGWVREAKLTLDYSRDSTQMGTAVRFGEDGKLLIGAPGYMNGTQPGGGAFLYEFTGNNWQQTLTLLPSVGQYSARFGYNLEYAGGIAVVSADDHYSYFSRTGAAYIFQVAVPEPSSCLIVMMGCGIFVSGNHRRRRVNVLREKSNSPSQGTMNAPR